jgi:hypothetical protein
VSAGRVLLLQAIVPLLAPGNSWVIQGRGCGMLTLLIRHELRTHVSLPHERLHMLPLLLPACVIMRGTVDATHDRITYRSPNAQQTRAPCEASCFESTPLC